ncbi:SDR family NAD(P)-dependent oxidoreductase [Pantoea sp. CCBC3-3-1]
MAVVGGTGGIGRAISRMLASSGAHVVVFRRELYWAM